jgi:hypothetical protein
MSYLALKSARGRYRNVLANLLALGTGVWLIGHTLIHTLAYALGVPCP